MSQQGALGRATPRCPAGLSAEVRSTTPQGCPTLNPCRVRGSARCVEARKHLGAGRRKAARRQLPAQDSGDRGVPSPEPVEGPVGRGEAPFELPSPHLLHGWLPPTCKPWALGRRCVAITARLTDLVHVTRCRCRRKATHARSRPPSSAGRRRCVPGTGRPCCRRGAP